MRIAGAVLTGLLGVLLVALGIGGADVGLAIGGSLQGWADGAGGRVVLAFAGLLLVALDMAFVMRALGFGASKAIEFDGPSGHMEVDISALEECLRRTALEDADVTDAAARLRVPHGRSRRPIVCNVDVGVRERVDIPGKGSEIAQRLKRRFLDVVPVEKDPVVNLRMRIRPREDAGAGYTPPSNGAGKPEGAAGAEEPLADVPEFTGERRYGDRDEEAAGT